MYWDTQAPAISTISKPDTIHDFGGFPKQLYEIEYPANSAHGMAAKASYWLMQARIDAKKIHTRRDLDHGAKLPRILMYPKDNITLTQISI